MKSVRTLLLIGSVTTICTGGYLIWDGRTAESQGGTVNSRLTAAAPDSDQRTDAHANGPDFTARAVKDDVAALRAEVKHLRQRLDTLAAEVSQSRPDAGRSAAQRNSEIDPDAPPFDAAQAETELRQKFDAIETAFESQPIDQAWVAKAEESLRLALAGAELGQTAPIDLHCRATICRIVAQHSDQTALEQFQESLQLKVADQFPSLTFDYTDDGNGLTTTTVYLFRAGYDKTQLQ